MIWDLFPNPGPTCHPTQTLCVLLCGLSSCCPHPPQLQLRHWEGEGVPVYCAHMALFVMSGAPGKTDGPPACCSSLSSCVWSEGGVCGVGVGRGRHVCSPDDSTARCCAQCAACSPDSKGGGPGCSSPGSQVTEQSGNTPSLCQVSSV